MLEERHGVRITYEDPPYHASQRQKPSPASPHFIPLAGPFSFEYQLGQGRSDQQFTAILTRLLREYRSTGYPGDFRLARSNARFHIIPVARRVRPGLNEPYEAILNTELDFTTGSRDRSVMQALSDFVEELTRVTGEEVILGTIPFNAFDRTRDRGRTGHSSPRSELIRILDGVDSELVWQLYYSPNDPPHWVLNIH